MQVSRPSPPSLIPSTLQIREYEKPPKSGILNILPDEILLHIFSFTNPFDLFRIQKTCKNLNRIAKDQHLWKTHYFKIFPDLSLLCILPVAKSNKFWENGVRVQVRKENKLLVGELRDSHRLHIFPKNRHDPFSEVACDPVTKRIFYLDESFLVSHNPQTNTYSLYRLPPLSINPRQVLTTYHLFGIFQGKYAVIERKSLSPASTMTPNVVLYDFENQRYAWSSKRYEKPLFPLKNIASSPKIPYFFSTVTNSRTSFSFLMRDFETGDICYQKDFENVQIAFKKFCMIQARASLNAGVVLIRYASQTPPFHEQFYIFQTDVTYKTQEHSIQNVNCLGFNISNGTFIMRDLQGVCSFWRGTSCLNDNITISDDITLGHIERANFYSSILCLYTPSSEICLYDMENKKTLLKTKFANSVRKYFMYQSFFCIQFTAWKKTIMRMYALQDIASTKDYEDLDWILGVEPHVLIGIDMQKCISIWDRNTGAFLKQLPIHFQNRNCLHYSEGILFVYYHDTGYRPYQIYSFL